MNEAQRGVALVTGASSGIGEACATVLAERGHDLIITARREDRLQALKQKLEQAHGVRVDVIVKDLSRPGSGQELHGEVKALGRDVRVLVNNAGFALYGKSLDHDYAKVQAMLELLVTSVTALTHLFGKDMQEVGHGRILQVASIGAFQPSPLYAVYSAAKAYMLSMSVAMNEEMRRTDVSITTLCPGYVGTDFHATAGHLKPETVEWTGMSAREAAEAGIDAMVAKRDVITPGWANKLVGGIAKLMPRSWTTSLAGQTMKARR